MPLHPIDTGIAGARGSLHTIESGFRAFSSGGPAALLLDAYPSASYAYGFRKLRAAYAGSAVRIRRSSDDATQDIGFSGNNFDTASAASFIGGGSGFVDRWYDQSATAGTEASQTSSGNQPAYNASSPLALSFSSGSDYMFLGAATPSPNLTVVASIQVANTAGDRGIISGAGNLLQWRVDADEKLTVNKRNVALVGTSSGALTVNVQQMVAFTYDGTNWAHYLEGSANGSGANAQTLTYAGGTISDVTGEKFDGYIMELVAWPSIFSSGDISALNSGYY